VFLWLWLFGWSVFVLPPATASLRGRAPRSVRRRTTPWGIRVRGVAMPAIRVGGLIVPLLRWSSLATGDAAFLVSIVQVGFLMLAAGLMSGSQPGGVVPPEGFGVAALVDYRRMRRSLSGHPWIACAAVTIPSRQGKPRTVLRHSLTGDVIPLSVRTLPQRYHLQPRRRRCEGGCGFHKQP
jgi:hypothetical protein